MEKSTVFHHRLLPYMLLLPQLVITVVFFYWPASQAIWQSFLREDAFGLSSEFVGLENYQALFAQPAYYKSMLTTAIFSALVAFLSLSIALLFASQADKNCRECRQRPAIADCRVTNGETVLHAALGHGCRDQSGEGQQRAHGKVDARSQNHKGHADGEKAGDGHLAHDVEEVDRREEAWLHDGENRHEQKQEDQRRKAREEGEGVEGPVGFF